MALAANSVDDCKSKLLPRLAQLGLPNDLITELLNDSIAVRYGKGFRPFLQGAPADVLMLIINGVAKVYCPQSNARRFLVELAGPGDIIGYADFVDSKGRRGQIFETEALTNCSVALIFRHRIAKRLQEIDGAALVSLVEQSNSFWSWVAYRYASMMSLSYRERLEVVLCEVARRFGVRESRGLLVTLELGHEDWAEMIGSSRPMVSRLFAEMVQAGVLAREGKRYILLNGAGLEEKRHLMPRLAQETSPSLRPWESDAASAATHEPREGRENRLPRQN